MTDPFQEPVTEYESPTQKNNLPPQLTELVKKLEEMGASAEIHEGGIAVDPRGIPVEQISQLVQQLLDGDGLLGVNVLKQQMELEVSIDDKLFKLVEELLEGCPEGDFQELVDQLGLEITGEEVAEIIHRTMASNLTNVPQRILTQVMVSQSLVEGLNTTAEMMFIAGVMLERRNHNKIVEGPDD